MGQAARWLALAMSLVVCGCGLINGVSGVTPDSEKLQTDPIKSAQIETTFIEGLRIRAGLPQQPAIGQTPTAADWKLVQRAGIRVIDGQCDQYLDALYQFNREQQAVRKGLTAATAQSGVILGLTRAAHSTVGIIAAAFGLSASLFDAGANSVLFTIEPSALRNVILEGRSRFIDSMTKNPPANRPDTMISLQGYLQQCMPAAIEANINLAANGSKNNVVSQNEEQAINAASLTAPAVTMPSREARAKAQVTGTVNPRPSPPPPSGDPDIRDNEKNLGVSESIVGAVQLMLGINPITKRIGTSKDATRIGIREFGRGLDFAGETGWESDDVAGEARDILVGFSSQMPTGLQSPFERAFLTKRDTSFKTIDPDQVAGLWLLLTKAPPPSGKDAQTLLAEMRPKIAERRSAEKLAPGTYVDSELYRRIKDKRKN